MLLSTFRHDAFADDGRPASHAGRELRVQLIKRAALADAAASVLRNEVADLWCGAGVDVRWVEKGDRPMTRSSAPEVYVIVAHDNDRAGAIHSGALATIRFFDGVPGRHILAYVNRAEGLLDTTAALRFFGDVRHRLVGRVLGRAIAHEVGHYVLGTPEHAKTGLMKNRHRIWQLASPDASPFRMNVSVTAKADCSLVELGWDARR